MLGGLFGRARKTFASRHEAFAAFVRAQFLPQYNIAGRYQRPISANGRTPPGLNSRT
jgi:hypothetical protein